ncbi:MAG: glycerol kinase GlpK [Bacillota bacterium]
MKKYIMSIDQGTTSSRAIIFDKNGENVCSSQREFPQIYPVPTWVEHDPNEIWESQLAVIKDCLKGEISASQICAIGITNQRETTVVWDKNTGELIYNAIVWQCRRTAEFCDGLKNSEEIENMIFSKTGLICDAYFSASKVRWILENVEGARKKAENGELCFGTIDTFLMWKLSGGKIFATDHTNASRTMLFNIHDVCWDSELLELFDIPKSMLPAVHPSSFCYGVTDKDIFGVEIPICGVAGDQQSALFGQLCHKKGDMKNTYGTGCFMLMHTGDNPAISKRGLLTTMAVSLSEKPQYALEGSVFVGGAVVQWLRDEMKMIEKSSETCEIARSVEDTNGVYIVPSFVGLGAPHWLSQAKGAVFGLTRGAGRAHFVRAGLESIAYQVFDVIHAMESDAGGTFEKLAVDGGACANDFLMQFQADIANLKVMRPKNIETTALGACYLAGLASGFWSSLSEIEKSKQWDCEFTPQMNEKTRTEKIMGWEDCILALKTFK